MKREVIRVEPLSTYLERWKAPTSAVTRHGDTIYVSGFPPFDPDTGEQVRVDTHSRRLRERYAVAAAADRAAVAVDIRRAGADHVVLSTQGEWLRPLLVALAKRDRRAS